MPRQNVSVRAEVVVEPGGAHLRQPRVVRRDGRIGEPGHERVGCAGRQQRIEDGRAHRRGGLHTEPHRLHARRSLAVGADREAQLGRRRSRVEVEHLPASQERAVREAVGPRRVERDAGLVVLAEAPRGVRAWEAVVARGAAGRGRPGVARREGEPCAARQRIGVGHYHAHEVHHGALWLPVERRGEHGKGVRHPGAPHVVLNHRQPPVPQRPDPLAHRREGGPGEEHQLAVARVEVALRRHLGAAAVHHADLVGRAAVVGERPRPARPWRD